MQYIEIHIKELDETKKDILMAFLPEFGFSQLEELDRELKAYASAEDAQMDALGKWMETKSIPFEFTTIQETNWNASWESNFQPVEIPGKILVRAHFHEPQHHFEHEIIITPKMSFGTGHHATTKMIMESMLEIDFAGKKVLDFGTGTGILSILAEKLGASKIMAIDNDLWSYENAIENISTNQSKNIEVKCKDDLEGIGLFDIILANINKNILLSFASELRQILNEKGIIILSGLLSEDYKEICSSYYSYFGPEVKQYSDRNWIALVFKL